jgi:hypothetical protein
VVKGRSEREGGNDKDTIAMNLERVAMRMRGEESDEEVDQGQRL